MILAVDTETGGLDPDKHQLMQIGIALLDGEEVIDSLNVQLGEHPKLDITLRALRLTETSMAMLKAGVDEASAYREVSTFIGKHSAEALTVVSHNAVFDQSFWSQFIFRQGSWEGKWPDKKYVSAHPLLLGPWVCTRRMASALPVPDHKLDTVAAHFGLSRETEAHGALEDAILCGRVYARLRA